MCHVRVVGLTLSRNAFLLFFPIFSPSLLNLSAPISLLQCQMSPLTLKSNAETLLFFPCGSLSPVYTPFYHLLPLLSFYVSFPFHFSKVCFLLRAKRAKPMTYMHWTIVLLCSSWFLVSLSALDYFLLFSHHFPFSSCLLNLICYFLVHSGEAVLTLRLQSEMLPTLLKKSLLCLRSHPSAIRDETAAPLMRSCIHWRHILQVNIQICFITTWTICIAQRQMIKSCPNLCPRVCVCVFLCLWLCVC